MTDILSFVVWNPDLTAFQIGSFSIRWYSLCWLIGLLLAYLVVRWLYKDQKVPQEKFEPLFIYCFLGILIGARLGHCIFYQPDYFLTSGKGFVEMLLPIHFTPDGDWHMVGYQGLASHGGTLGLILALLLYCRRLQMPMWQVLDNIAIATGTTACLIRIGNLMNSEIIGRATDVPWAFIFERVDLLPRHPGQLYEAIAYAVYFLLCIALYSRERGRLADNTTDGHAPRRLVGTGFYFGLCLTFIFTFRFFIEFTKEVQEEFEQSMALDMGQLLSLPFVAVGLWFMIRGWKSH